MPRTLADAEREIAIAAEIRARLGLREAKDVRIIVDRHSSFDDVFEFRIRMTEAEIYDVRNGLGILNLAGKFRRAIDVPRVNPHLAKYVYNRVPALRR